MKFKTYNLDCRDVMDMFLPDNSVDSIVTDPPYGLSFMGKGWDHGVPSVEFWERAFRVLKPGGHLLAFGGPRTYHRLACAIEDAGFEIRDSCIWMFSQGFPKSLDVSKAIDKAAGAEREVIRTEQNYGVTTAKDGKQAYGDYAGEWNVTAPSTELAKQWAGFGTALKPAYEPVVVARKPLIGTVVQNVLMHGVGGLNIDGCRVATSDKLGGGHASGGQQMRGGWERPWMQDADAVAANAARSRASIAKSEDLGRWPANLIHDGSAEVVALFPDSKGQLAATGTRSQGATYGAVDGGTPGIQPRDDSGSAARFFYVPKASKKDRNEGCEALPLHTPTHGKGHESGGLSVSNSVIPNNNNHPTVKPTDLMAYLCRLVTPPGGTVLDPFMGSGSTGKAALREGFRFIGCELEPEYHAIADARLKAAV